MDKKNTTDFSAEEVSEWFRKSLKRDSEERQREESTPPPFKKGEGVEQVPAATDDSI